MLPVALVIYEEGLSQLILIIWQHNLLYCNHNIISRYVFKLFQSLKKREADLNKENLWHQRDQSLINYLIAVFHSIHGHEISNN